MNRHANGRGLYFERMTMFGRGGRATAINWSGFCLSTIRARACAIRCSKRRSSIQHATTSQNAQLGFPCLQHVSFEPTAAGLVINAFYATQYIFDKAYGNYLGLAQLGAFMAHEMGMPLARLNVMVGVAKLDGISKSDAILMPLIAAARAALVAPLDGSGSACRRRLRRQGQRFEEESLQSPPPNVRAAARRNPALIPQPPRCRIDLPVSVRAPEPAAAATDAPTPIVLRHLAPAKVSEVYESYWRFAAERQAVFFRRARGETRPGPAMRCSRPTSLPTPIARPIGSANI